MEIQSDAPLNMKLRYYSIKSFISCKVQGHLDAFFVFR